ncbi:MAG: hypothetical protein SGJ02_12630 [bacterium]|nr:hypothetical protein [bacterium]
MTDEVAGQRSLFAVGESFATGPWGKTSRKDYRIPEISLVFVGNMDRESAALWIFSYQSFLSIEFKHSQTDLRLRQFLNNS